MSAAALARPAYLEQSTMHLGEDVTEDGLVGQLVVQALQTRGTQRQPRTGVALDVARPLRRRVLQRAAQLVEQRLNPATYLRR